MTDYAWFPVTGSGGSYTWNPTGNWNNGAYWTPATSSSFPPPNGTVPGSGDGAYIVSGNSAFGPPPPYPSPPYNVTITLRTVQAAATVGLGSYALFASVAAPSLEIVGGSLTVGGAMVDHFTKTFPSPVGTQTFSGGGGIDLASAGRLEVGTTVDPNILITFDDTTADTLVLDGVDTSTPNAMSGVIYGFEANNVIDLTGIAYSGASLASYDPSFGTLTIDEGGSTAATLTINGLSAVTDFQLKPDSGTGTEIVLCFAAGTRIATPSGGVAVEALRPGDGVSLADGGVLPVRWIGRRSIDIAAHRQPELVRPVRIRADAFAPAQPERDLLLSPDHAVFVDSVLIPARLLVNGASIAVADDVARVTYFHVELDRHAVILAEGLSAESYLDTGNRAAFANAGVAASLHADFAPRAWGSDACAPLATKPALVEPVWRRLAERAGVGAPAMPAAAEGGLWLDAEGGPVRLMSDDGERRVFALPHGTRAVRLRSAAARPSDAHPWIDDRRQLGVAVHRIVLHGAAGPRELALDDMTLADGWWTAERTGATLWRWTDGDAHLPLPAGIDLVELRVAAPVAVAAAA